MDWKTALLLAFELTVGKLQRVIQTYWSVYFGLYLYVDCNTSIIIKTMLNSILFFQHISMNIKLFYSDWLDSIRRQYWITGRIYIVIFFRQENTSKLNSRSIENDATLSLLDCLGVQGMCNNRVKLLQICIQLERTDFDKTMSSTLQLRNC